MPTRLNIYGQTISTTKKRPCIVATTGNIVLSGATTPTSIDGINVYVDDRILVWQQNSPQDNGIYRLETSELLSRDYDFNISDDLYAGIEVLVLSGSTHSGKTFYLKTTGDLTIGSSSLIFDFLPGITSYTNPADNRVLTSVSSTAINAEANLTFDGSILDVNTTAAFKLPVGTTEERPVSPTTGYIRYNTSTSELEIHLGGRWQKFTISDYSTLVEYLVIAGGGGGSTTHGGGGGAGGYRNSVSGELSGANSSAESILTLNLNTNILVTVGAGGSQGLKGNNSVFSIVTSEGGGLGGTFGVGGTGGSGGGAGSVGGTNYSGGSGTASQGFAGGSSVGSPQYGSGGGGGSSSVGTNGNTSTGGNGGNGLSSSITGISTTRGGGGGAGSYSGAGTGGLGGGGNSATVGVPGTANTGGGGGAKNLAGSGTGGSGGSGVVIIRYSNTLGNLIIGSGLIYRDSSGVNQNGSGVSVAPSYAPTGYKVYQFNGGTGNIQFQS